ncbi:MAG: hypothetical protein DMG89_25025 [Acidobacteria bacterium]|nr:MAG: hypothetical protein DMG89_25025 [Acidobacteriota bacterium]
MPWKASSVMEEKLRFVFEYEQHEQTMRDVCQSFGISRETGYFWLRRYQTQGVMGLAEVNRTARHHPNQTVAEIEQLVLELRQAGAHALGAAEAETDSGAGSAGTALAGGEHHGRDAAAGRLGGAAPQAAANRALHPTAGARRGTQPGVVRGLQGLVSHR